MSDKELIEKIAILWVSYSKNSITMPAIIRDALITKYNPELRLK